MSLLNSLAPYYQNIGILSSGIFAGSGLSILYVSVPAIKASKDPLPSFVTTYNKGKHVAMISILISTVTSVCCYYETKNQKFLYSAIASAFSAPFTGFFIAPVNKKLFALQKEKEYDVKHINKLLDRWQILHSARFVAGIAAFLINVFIK